jgi:4-carboxymuconolactone decarboxylase
MVSQPPVQSWQTATITRVSQHLNKGSAEYFTGLAQVQPLFPAADPSRTSGEKVTFEAAREAHRTRTPSGQILIVSEGTGLIQQWGDPIEQIREGDVIRIQAGVKRRYPKYVDDAHCHTGMQW